jgi:hypothetical protein
MELVGRILATLVEEDLLAACKQKAAQMSEVARPAGRKRDAPGWSSRKLVLRAARNGLSVERL